MYWYKQMFYGTVLLAGMTFLPFSGSQAEATYKPSGEEIAGVSVRFGGGYYPGYRGRYYNRPYRGYYGYPGYYRYRYNRPYRYYNYPGYYYSPYYSDYYWYRYGRPGGGVYFRFGN